MKNKIIFTIANDYYFQQVLALKNSIKNFKNYQFIWVRLERDNKNIKPYSININEIIENDIATLAQYNITEAATAVKARCFKYFLEEKLCEDVIYIDPDIKFYCNESDFDKNLSKDEISITPHILSPYRDDQHPSELSILNSGTYNLGFLHVRNTVPVKEFIDWWASKLLFNCHSNISTGVFTDQKWCDLIPSFFINPRIIRHPGFNVAYWNLHERIIDENKGSYFVNGQPLIFIHFSGILDDQRLISKHSNRSRKILTETAIKLFTKYSEELKNTEIDFDRNWSYEIPVPYMNVPIPQLARAALNDVFLEKPNLFTSIKNDFDCISAITTSYDNSSFVGPLVKRIFISRPDVYKEYNKQIHQGDYKGFLEWVKNSGKTEMPGIESLILNIKNKNYLSKIYEILSRRNDVTTHYKNWQYDNNVYLELRKWFLTSAITEEQLEKISEEEFDKVCGISAIHRIKNYFLISEHKKITSAVIGQLSKLASLNDNEIRFYNYSLRENKEKFISVLLGEIANKSETIKEINYYSYEYTNTGLGQAARSLISILENNKISFNRVFLPSSHSIHPSYIRSKLPSRSFGSSINDAKINIFHCNLDEATKLVINDKNINIIYCVWEVELLPKEYADQLERFDLIFTPSIFVKNILRKYTKKNICVLHHPISELAKKIQDTKEFIRSKDVDSSFTFGYMMDFSSVVERKNPLGLIEAFQSAFPKRANHLVRLRIKLGNIQANIEYYKLLLAKTIDDRRIELLSDVLNDNELKKFYATLDCYITLHRSEGFGLTLLESIALGLEVISTNYGGITEELNKLFLPVSYKLVKIGPKCQPYPPDSHWAEPNISDAVNAMQKIYHAKKIKRVSKNLLNFEDDYIANKFFNDLNLVKNKFLTLK